MEIYVEINGAHLIEAIIEVGLNGQNYYLIDNNALYTVGFGSTC